MKYFEIFDLEPSLELDLKKLKKQYYQLSKETHPDYFTMAGKEVQEEKLDASSILNEAYQTLRLEELRIKYLLSQKGLLKEGEQSVPQAFLMEMMDINETIMMLEVDADEKKRQQAMNRVSQFNDALQEQLRAIKERWTWPAEESLWRKLKDYYLKHRYLLRIKENLSKFADQ